MKIRSLILAAAAVLWGSAGQAATYTYIGNPTFGTASYVTAKAELDCTAPCAAGEYIYSASISEFSLSIYSSSDTLLQSLSSNTPGVSLGVHGSSYLTLDTSGNVISWFLYLEKDSLAPQIYTMKDALGSLTMDVGLFSIDCDSTTTYVNLVDTPGSWQVAAVPEPSTWAMIILGFAGMGFMGWRRSRRDQKLAFVKA